MLRESVRDSSFFFILLLFCLILVESGLTQQPQQTQQAQQHKGYFTGEGKLVSIVVTVHNNAKQVTSLLESVEESVERFLDERKKEGEGQQQQQQPVLPSFEILIVDYNSKDATPLKTRRFIETKKQLPNIHILRNGNLTLEERKSRITYYLVHLTAASNISPATAKNIGVDLVSGDMLFFADASSLWTPEHVSTCYKALIEGGKAAVRTGVEPEEKEVEEVEEDMYGDRPSARPIKMWDTKRREEERQKELKRKRKEEMEKTSTNMCIWKRVHTFIEGFPEQAVFYSASDISYSYLSSLRFLGFPVIEIPERTVEVSPFPMALCTPDSELDEDPELSKQTCTEEHEDIRKVQRIVEEKHHMHLRKKFTSYLQGNMRWAENKHWAIYTSNLRAERQIGKIHQYDTRNTRYQEMLIFANHLMGLGELENCQRVFNVTQRYVYNPRVIPQTSFSVYTTMETK